MKKFLAILLLAAMLLTLTGCFDIGGDSPAPVAPVEQKVTVWLVSSIVTENGTLKYSFTYDERGNLLEADRDAYFPFREVYTYNDKNQKVELKVYDDSDLWYTSTYVYDDKDRLVERIDDDGYKGVFTYDDKGNLLSENFFWVESGEESGHLSQYTYDAEGKLIQMDVSGESAAEYTVHYAYDAQGHLTTETHTDQHGRLETSIFYSYNENGKLIKQATHDDEGYEMQRREYTYDENGNVSREDVYYDDSLDRTAYFTYESFTVSPARAKVLRKQNKENMDW